jgi:hypothetical protein
MASVSSGVGSVTSNRLPESRRTSSRPPHSVSGSAGHSSTGCRCLSAADAGEGIGDVGITRPRVGRDNRIRGNCSLGALEYALLPEPSSALAPGIHLTVNMAHGLTELGDLSPVASHHRPTSRSKSQPGKPRGEPPALRASRPCPRSPCQPGQARRATPRGGLP